MSNPHKPLPPTKRWIPALVMLTVALLVMASLLNGVGQVGVMAPPASGGGHYIEATVLSGSEQIPFARVDRAIKRLRPAEDGRPEEFEAYEQVLLALSEAMPEHPGHQAIARAQTLLSGSLPGPAAADLVELLPGFLAYRRAERSLLELTPGGPRTIEGAYVRLKLQEALRRVALGDNITDQLYRTSHLMTETHLVRQLLMQRDDLDEKTKQRLIRQQMESLAAREPGGDAE